MRARRKQLSAVLQTRHSRAVCQHVIKRSNRYYRHKNIGIYQDFDGELATSPLIKRLRRCGARLYVPAIDEYGLMSFAPLLLCGSQTLNPLNILQPATINARIKPQQIDLLFTPLTAFDQQGNRLGMGAGYYDRCFAYKRNAPAKKPLMIGLAHACQKLGYGVLQAQTWDVPLDCIADENGLDKCLYRGR